ncbi:unnamed protein product [Polarella glacialis]|uniref:Uncharacterized protein n=1 Tax=Polarella glacialis TaxID=89957 RepID=A0A813JN12_POLGL|nr:unnamed protein product [Polarella glacialis]
MTLALLQESSSSDGVAFVEIKGLGLVVAVPKEALPRNIVGKLAISAIMLPTGSTSNSSRRLPRKGNIEESERYWESAIITGPVVDITLVSVDSGVKPVPVQNLDEPILIRLSGSRFESGTRCRYRNSLTGWSSDGVSVATEEEIRAFLPNSSNASDRANALDGLKEGFWCATYHLSMFAPVKIIQNPPLVQALSRSEPLLASASWLLALIPIGLFLCTIICYVVARCRVMKGGSVEMAREAGGFRDVRFKIHRPSRSTGSSGQGPVKTHVVWDIKPKLYLQGRWELSRTRAQHQISRNSMEQQEIETTLGVNQHLQDSLSQLSLSDYAQHQEAQPAEQERLDSSPRSSEEAVEIIVPDTEVAHEVYEHGASVEYYSKTTRRWLPAQIQGAGFSADESLPTYQVLVKVNRKRSLRHAVELSDLRLAFQQSDKVDYNWKIKRVWRAAAIDGKPSSAATALGYPIRCEEDLTGPEIVVQWAPAAQLRSRWPEGSQVDVYQSPAIGWMPAMVVRTQECQPSVTDDHASQQDSVEDGRVVKMTVKMSARGDGSSCSVRSVDEYFADTDLAGSSTELDVFSYQVRRSKIIMQGEFQESDIIAI